MSSGGSSGGSSMNGSTAAATAAMVVTALAALYATSSSGQGKKKVSYLLVGDIGGTNSRLALYDATTQKELFIKIYSNSSRLGEDIDPTTSFGRDIVNYFLSEASAELVLLAAGEPQDLNIVACFACAGPVTSNKVTMTNIGPAHPSDDSAGGTSVTGKKQELVIDGQYLQEATTGYLRFIRRAIIINDFVGLGYGALDLDLSLTSTEVRALTPNSRQVLNPTGPKACIGAGTGLGECYLTSADDQTYTCFPSEGGHVEFAPRTDLEMELLSFLKKKFSARHRVSVERVVSGKGLANVYEFLAQKFPDRVDAAVHEEFMAAGDLQGKVVGVNASTKGSLCEQAMLISMGAYGSEAGCCSLKFIPTGGLFVTGGLTPKNIKYIEGETTPFMQAYKDKGRVSGLLDQIPIFAVMTEDLGMRGAKVCALQAFQKQQAEEGF